MTIQDYRVTDVRADMTYGHFRDVLVAANSPALPEAHGMYSHLVANRGVSVAAFLAFFSHESAYGRLGICKTFDTKNPGNVRSPEVLGAGVVIDTPRGKFAKYADWRAGTEDWVARINGPKYAGAGLTTVRQILPKYAPSSENDTARYVNAVLAEIARHTSSQPPQPTKGATMPPKPQVTSSPSPNRGYNNGHTHRVEAIVNHITDGTNSLGWLTNPASNASSNYLIARNGTIYELVPPTESAWANGAVRNPDTAHPLIVKWLREGCNFNQRCVSIEHENKSSQRITPQQVAASVRLQAWLCAEFGLSPLTALLGHNQIDSRDRAHCPGWTAADWAAIRSGIQAALVGGGTPAPATLPPVVTERVDWDGRGRLISEEVTVVNDSDPAHPVYYSRKRRHEAAGVVLDPWKEV